MEIEKISNNHYKFTFINETYTIVQMFQEELLKIDIVEMAGFNQPHPLESYMILHVKTVDKNPKDVLNSVIDTLVKKIDDIDKLIQ
jgi:DNA-directed RNA polymerase subunit L